MKRPPPKIGRKVEKPEQVDYDAAKKALVAYAGKILRDCGAPSHWGDNEFQFILGVAWAPETLIKTGEPGKWFVYLDRETRELLRPGLLAMQFANLLCEAPDAVMRALPEIRASIEKKFNTAYFVVAYWLLYAGPDWDQSHRTAQEIADSFSPKWKRRLNITEDVVEKARRWIKNNADAVLGISAETDKKKRKR